MPSKIMLVVENLDDQEFLEKVLERLKYSVISMKKGRDLSEQLIDHFPDVVFASTLGRNTKLLNALGKIKEVRGKPKLVFVKMKNESHALNSDQKAIIDGTLYTPVDPFKLIDLLAATTDVDIIELRRRYNEMLARDKGRLSSQAKGGGDNTESDSEISFKAQSGRKDVSQNYGQTQVFGCDQNAGRVEYEDDEATDFGETQTYQKPERLKKTPVVDDESEKVLGQVEVSAKEISHSPSQSENKTQFIKGEPVQSKSSLIHDDERKKRYKQWTDRFKESGEQPTPIDVQQLREKQSKQAREINEDPSAKENRKHFLKTLFSMDPNKASTKGD